MSRAMEYAKNVIKSFGNVSDPLYEAYKYATWRHTPYANMVENYKLGSEWYADYGFKHHEGNCYSKAAMAYFMAKQLCYNIRQITGYVDSLEEHAEHSWLEFTYHGEIYIMDLTFEYPTHRYGYWFKYGQKGHWIYHKQFVMQY